MVSFRTSNSVSKLRCFAFIDEIDIVKAKNLFLSFSN